jgi:hypothetical protein
LQLQEIISNCFDEELLDDYYHIVIHPLSE